MRFEFDEVLILSVDLWVGHVPALGLASCIPPALSQLQITTVVAEGTLLKKSFATRKLSNSFGSFNLIHTWL